MTLAARTAVHVRAYAKINLDLRILGTRPDGFHELRTVFQSLALHDTITFTRRRGPFRLSCDEPGVPLGRANLVWQAAERLWRMLGKAGRLRDVAVRLEKQVPAEAGLGGGSADAAATLRALARLWGVSVRAGELAHVAAALGADVPFFLRGGTALGLGRGDEITPLPDMPRHPAVLVLPKFGVSSREAYRWYDAGGAATAGSAPASARSWSPGAARMANDLEPAVTRRHQEIGRMKAALEVAGAWAAAMSGSGSAVYGLFERREEARDAAGRLASGSWRIVVTELLDRRAYARRARPVGSR